jgi:4-hydroxybenzoate polyprenyltransferase
MKIGDAMLAFVAFSLAASTVYVFNDIHDRQADALHPNKCQRPIACGQVAIKQAYWLLASLLIMTLLISLFISYNLIVIILIYWLINFGYNMGLKGLPIIDVLSIASGFVLRMLAGTLGIGLKYSRWLLISVTFLSLLIALSKRYLEKKRDLVEPIRPVLSYYSLSLLKAFIIINAVFAMLSYLVYITAVHRQNLFFLLTTVFALLGMVRYIQVIFQSNRQQDDPILVMIDDRTIIIYLVGFAICTMLAFLGI